jgi:two-component system response regulator AlgR
MQARSSAQLSRTLLIVDDEAPARERLERLVAEIPGWEVSGTCASGLEALDLVGKQNPAVVLLDIRMPGINGIEVARHLARLDAPPAVVFTTAYDEFALQAFDSCAVGYVLKPVRRERLAAALGQAARLSDGTLRSLGETQRDFAAREQIAVKVRDELRLVAVANVRYFRADQKYTTVRHVDGDELIEESLKHLEDEFSRAFVRIHRSVLVALAHVEAIERTADGGYRVKIRNSEERLTVSRRQISELKSRLAARR